MASCANRAPRSPWNVKFGMSFAFEGAAKGRQPSKSKLISDEAVKTSQIEGEILNRATVQSSLRQQLGLGTEQPGVKPPSAASRK